MDKDRRKRSDKKRTLILVGTVIVGCFLIGRLGFHSETKDEEKGLLKNNTKVKLTSYQKATEANFKELKFDNMDLAGVNKVPSISKLYEGIFYLPDTSSIVEQRAVSFFKKQSEEMKRTYNKKFLRPYNKRYVPLGRDYQVDDDNGMSYSTTGFFTCFQDFDSANFSASCKQTEDLVGDDMVSHDSVLRKRADELNELIRNTGCSFDVEPIPHALCTLKNKKGEVIKKLSFQISYDGIPFSDISPNMDKYALWDGCGIWWMKDDDDRKCIILSKMTLKPKKLQKVDYVISAEDAIGYLSKELSGHHKYKVSSIQMEYVSTLTDKEIKEGKQNLYLNSFVEGGEYVVKPYWTIYMDVSNDNAVVGYVDAENGDVIFVHSQL